MGKHKKPLEITKAEEEYVTGCFTQAELANRYGVTPNMVAEWARKRDWAKKREDFARRKCEKAVEKQLDRLAELDARALGELCELEKRTYQAGSFGQFDNSNQAIQSFLGVIRLAREIMAGREGHKIPRLTVKLPDGTEITASNPEDNHQAEAGNGDDPTASDQD